MNTIYVFTPRAMIRRIGQRLIVEKDQQLLYECPLKDVGRVLLYGTAHVPFHTLDALLTRNVSIYYLRRSGAIKGKMMAACGAHVPLRQRQYRLLGEDKVSISLARAIVHTKITNMATVIVYLLRNGQGTAAACRAMEEACCKLEQCQTREQLMGVEGAAACQYFRIYGSNLPEPFRFHTRTRQPAQDPTNALLNLGYMTLMREVQTHLEAHHFDPFFGVLHAIEESRPNLALDMMEEFRQTMVDLFVLRAVRYQQILPTDFQATTENGVQMSEEGFCKFFRLYQEYMGQQDGDNPGLRKLIDIQVASLKRFLFGEGDYSHFRTECAQED
jgi:CRISPR-associated protein Cas1